MFSINEAFGLSQYPKILKAMVMGGWVLDFIMSYTAGRLLITIAKGGASFVSTNNTISIAVAILITILVKRYTMGIRMTISLSMILSGVACSSVLFIDSSPSAAIMMFGALRARDAVLVKYNADRSVLIWGNKLDAKEKFSIEVSNVSRYMNLIGGGLGMTLTPNTTTVIIVIIVAILLDQGLDLWAHRKLNLAND